MSKPKPKITCPRDGMVKVDGIEYRIDPRFNFCLSKCEHRNNAMECPNNLIVCPHIYLRPFSEKPPDLVFRSDKTLGQTIENIKNQKVEKPYMSNAWAFGSTPDTRAAKDAKIKAAKAAKAAKIKAARKAKDKAFLKAYDKLKAAKDQQRLDEIFADLEAGRYSISLGQLFVDSELNRERITKAEYVKDKFEEPENTDPHKIDNESYIGGNNSDVELEEPYRDLDNSKKPLYDRSYKRLTKAKEDELLAIRKFNKETQLYSFPKTEKGRSNQDKLCKANIWAIRAVAKRYKYNSAKLTFDDLFAAGTIGLTEAMHRYDPTKNTQLSTYAWWYVAKTVNEAIGKETKISCQPEKVQRICKSLKREIEFLYKLTGKNPTEDEIVGRVAQLLTKEKRPTIRQVYRFYVVDDIPPVERKPLDDEPEDFIDTDSDQEEDLTMVKSYGDSEIQTCSLDESETGISANGEKEGEFIDHKTLSAKYCFTFKENWLKFLWIVHNKLDTKLGDILKMRHGAMTGDNREYNFAQIGKHYGCDTSTASRWYWKAIETVREAWDNC
ncbi:MAG TPA: sigma-70 family RNA polymerase sigma factor [Sedimentisphaerales bacterium]|nr:sigma-70 family RNA polymerase sigma factor [Sedimentisphaerales bacterium]